MKNYFLSMLLLLVTSQLCAQNEKEPYKVQHFANTDVKHVKAETNGGNITIAGEASGANTRVEIFITPNGRNRSLSKEEIARKLEADYDLTVSVSGGTVTAIAKRKKENDRNWDWNNALNVSFSIYVPKNVSTDLHTSGGNIKLSELNGDQEFTTSGGNLTLTSLSGKMNGKTSGGNIWLKDSKDDIHLSTSGGNITADNCNGKIDIRTSGGSLNLSELKGTIDATTSGGNVHADHISGDLNTHTSGGSITVKEIGGSLDASTSGGNIDASFTSVNKSIRLSNSGGDISLRLPRSKGMDLHLSADNIRTESLPAFKGTQDKERIDGSVNGGGVSVKANAGSGTIRLLLQ